MPAAAIPVSAMPVKEGIKGEDGKPLQPLPPKVYDAEADIKKFGLQPTEMLEYRDKFTGEMKKIMIDRRGTTDETLALALLDDTMSRERKDTMISMHLFERGKQGASFLMDLLGYKGQHTKESRAFQSTMRFDFELFLQTFQMFMLDSAELIFKNLPIEIVEVEAVVEGKTVKKEVVRATRRVENKEIAEAVGELGRYFKMTSSLLGKRIRAEVNKRERAKGKGVYIGRDGRSFSVHEDGDIVEMVQQDREEAVKQRDALVALMPELSEDALRFILEGHAVTLEQFIEAWNEKYPGKSYKKDD